MRKTLFTLLAILTMTTATAQTKASYEPEFIGETNLLCINDKDTTSFAAEKQIGVVKAKAGASVYLTGIGSVKSRIQVEGATSTCVGSDAKAYRLVVEAADNRQDPNSFIQIMKFESKGDKRRCVIAKSNTFGGAQSGADDLVSFQAKKYGDTAYILNIPSTPGEYGVIVSNPNNLTEKNMTVYCYTIK